MHRLGISIIHDHLDNNTYKSIKSAGFDCVMLSYFANEPIKQIAELILANDLAISSVHAPLANINTLWREGTEGDDHLAFLKTRIDFCSEYKVDKMVLHTSFGDDLPPVSRVGLDRFKDISDYAKSRNVHICFENVDEAEHLISVMNAADPYHGFCWDIGHHKAYFPEYDFNEMFPGRLMYLHIHDNHGTDEHLLPFEGTIDWNQFAGTLKKLNFTGDITLEPSYRLYKDLPIDEYLHDAYERASKLRDMLI